MVLVLNLQLTHWFLHTIKSTYQRWKHLTYLHICLTFMMTTYDDLVRKSRDIFTSMSCTSKQVRIPEEITKSQSKSNLWCKLRRGRITASKFYNTCKTKPTSTSISLVKEICCGTKKFHSKATDCGCKHEKTASLTAI